MLAYAANRPVAAERGSAPNAMLAIIALHVAAVAALMSAKMDLPPKIVSNPIDIDWIDPIKPPPQRPIEGRLTQPGQSTLTRPESEILLPPIDSPLANPGLAPNFDGLVGSTLDPGPKVLPIPAPAPVKIGARLFTSESELKPPYPSAKLASGEEAVLRLNLTIDQRGRVVAVEPIGRADKVFLEAARRHLLAHWRYKPATEDGRSVASTIVVTLRFQLDG